MMGLRGAASLAAVLVVACAQLPAQPAAIETALARAGRNRAELERVLAHYTAAGDPEALEAARFLIAHMPGHGRAEVVFEDEAGKEVAFDALAYPDFAAASAAFAALEAERGTLRLATRRFDADLESISAEYLIQNVDAALETWRTRPWAAHVSFASFLEYVLPYRTTNEPLETWRAPAEERLGDVGAGLADARDLAAASAAVASRSRDWVRFDELYYLHPTDQGWAELLRTRAGRCEDMATARVYAARASGIPATYDWTPFWADRDNNHGWEVLLNAEGHGRAPLAHRAAKVYRRTFSLQMGALGALPAGEDVPLWLADAHQRDVTAEYVETSDVRVSLEQPTPAGARFAYLAVWNGGEWRPVQGAPIDAGAALFRDAGRAVVYLPGYWTQGAFAPASAPFVLEADGRVRRLGGSAQAKLRLHVAAGSPGSEPGAQPASVLATPGLDHELFVWEDGWRSVAELRAVDAPVAVEVPAGHLYRLVAENSRGLERIFTVEEGRPVLW